MHIEHCGGHRQCMDKGWLKLKLTFWPTNSKQDLQSLFSLFVFCASVTEVVVGSVHGGYRGHRCAQLLKRWL